MRPYADAFVRWRSGEAEQRTFDIDLGDIRLQGRLDQLYPAGLARFRFEALHGPSQIAHGLDWLVLSALGDARALAQFAETAAGPGPHLRDPIPPAQACAALRALVTLRAWGLRDPLPFLSRAGWLWYDARANGKDGWPKAEAQWRGSARSWGEAGTASARLALRGHDPFDDDALGEDFRRIAELVFDAVVHGRSEGEAGCLQTEGSRAAERPQAAPVGRNNAQDRLP